MNLTHKEADTVFAIMRELSGDFPHKVLRERVGLKLLELLKADYFASYVWSDTQRKFDSCVQINMSSENLVDYERYYQFRDPITHTLQQRKRATPVSQVMSHQRLAKTEFFNDFLQRDGLCYGMNFFAYDRAQNIGDMRIWRGNKQSDFNERDAKIIDAIGPSFVNALLRAKRHGDSQSAPRFVQIKEKFGLTQREAEVADLLATGLCDADICTKLTISKPTLRSHISANFRKLGVQRRAQIAQLLHSSMAH